MTAAYLTRCARIIHRISITVFALLLIIASTASATRLKGQMITWSSFHFVQSVAASISHVYFATTNGVVRYDKLAHRWELPLTGSDGLNTRDIKRIWVTRFDDHLYAQTELGYFDFDVFFDRWYPRNTLPELDTVYAHTSVPTDLIPPAGFNYFSQGDLTDLSGRKVPISTVIQDNTGDLWVGTWGFGPARTPGGSLELEFLQCGLLQNRVNAMYVADSSLVVSGLYDGGARQGITEFNTADFSSEFIEAGVIPNFSPSDIISLLADSAAIYIGTPTGLLTMDRNSQQVTRRLNGRNGLLDDSVFCFAHLSDSLFVGTSAGLCLLRNDTVKYIAPRLLGSHRIFHLEPQDGNLWIASDYGAYRLNLKTGEIGKFLDPGKFTADRIYDIARVGRFLWMSADNGLLRVNLKTAQTEPYRLALFSNVRRPLAVNDKVAAVASDRGIWLIHYDRAKPISREFTIDDGLPSDRVNCLAFDGDYLWIGSDGGLTRFWWNDPERVD